MWKLYFEDDDGKLICFRTANTEEEIREKTNAWLTSKFGEPELFGTYRFPEQESEDYEWTWEWIDEYEIKVRLSESCLNYLSFYIKEYQPENAFRSIC